MNKKEKLAYALAEFAHDGQLYGNKDYFQYHVLGVANQFSPNCNIINKADRVCNKCDRDLSLLFSSHGCKSYDSDGYIVALLHDVVEDGSIGLTAIYQIFGNDIHFAIVNLTRFSRDSYSDYIFDLSCCESEIAIKVKIADLKFNLSQPDTKPSLVKRYTEALAVLEGV